MKEGAWTTLSKNSVLRNETPQVRVTAYPLKSTQLKQAINGFAAIKEKTTEKFYNELYSVKDGKKDIKNYVFPYFNNDFRSFNNEFADTLSNITDRGTVSVAQVATQIGGELAGAAGQLSEIMKLFNGDPGGPNTGTYIETPKFYQFDNTDAPLSFSFPLLNTVDEEDISNNQTFINEFTEINRPTRQDAMSMSMPYIYKVNLKGLRFIRWAYLDSLSFSMVGQRRLIGETNMVPEAYMCTMSFRSLTVEVANFMKNI